MSANNFLYDTRDQKFILKEWLDLDKLLSEDAYRDYYSKDDVDSFIDLAFKISRDVLAPANDEADKIGVKFENGQVITPDSFKNAYRTVVQAELASQIADREAEGRIPLCIYAPLLELMSAGCASIVPYWALSSGAAGVIQMFCSEEIKAKFLSQIFSGKWSGTMNLTESQAGSDLGSTATKAYPTTIPGQYLIKGTKQFITGGDSDLVENVVHLVLARIEGAKKGSAGLSLFIVPKIWVNDDGSLGESNDVTTVGIEHKLGLKGSATCSLSFGENNKCTGYLIGTAPQEDGKGQGIAQMFNMMNEERLNTGMLALSVTAEAYYNSLQYSKERVQGTKFTDPRGPMVRIIDHEDVRRMLLHQKSCVEAIRALLCKTYWYVDMSHEAQTPEERQYFDNMVQINDPLCKAYASYMAWPLIGEAIQVYGGNGFIEDYPVAQLARDCKVYSIWEGTNFIQSLDLVGRKFTMGKGLAFKQWLTEIASFIENNKKVYGFKEEFNLMDEAWQAYQSILELLENYRKSDKPFLVPLYATRILLASSMIYCAMLILDQALVASRKLAELGEDHYDMAFYKGKIASARFYIKNELLGIFTIKKALEIADTSAVDMLEAGLG
jgi:alkylation response protein AidB-like acyl-CoA dehydrogenase